MRTTFDFTTEEKNIFNSIYIQIQLATDLTWPKLRTILHKFPKNGNSIYSKDELIAGFRELTKEGRIAFEETSDFLEKLQLKPTRTISGVATVTVLTKPYPCPGECIFCPNDIRMPKSYLSDEPGAQRAERNNFDPYLQTYRRLKALYNIGHSVDKIEVIILGGTWSFYPERYQIWFIKRIFEALNEFSVGLDNTDQVEKFLGKSKLIPEKYGKNWLSRLNNPNPHTNNLDTLPENNNNPRPSDPPGYGKFFTKNGVEKKASLEAITSRGNFYINLKLMDKAKKMAESMTDAEKNIWFNILTKRKTGYKFLKQQIIGNYILDFYCSELMLVVEIDGQIQKGRVEYDQERDKFLNQIGISVIRFSNEEVLNLLNSVETKLKAIIINRAAQINPTNITPLARGSGIASGVLETSSKANLALGPNIASGVLQDQSFLDGAAQITNQKPTTYNIEVTKIIKETRGKLIEDYESARWEDLEIQQKINETAKCRNVGLVIETRPDKISPKEVIRIRRLGCTKTQIGIQSLNDEVLDLNHRGHHVQETGYAFKLLRQAGLKIHGHWMANLYGSTPEKDIQDYQKLFSDPDFCPDELKVYPCSLLETAELMDYYKKGLWKPYSFEDLLEVVSNVIGQTPQYCRLSRVIRDIPGGDIVVGNKLTNFREYAEKELDRLGVVKNDIRSREIKGKKVLKADLELKIIQYPVQIGQEQFLQFVTKENQIAGFLRLSLPSYNVHPFITELSGCAVIREVHVYGKAVSIGENDLGKAQHLGLGTELIEKAKEIVKDLGYKKLAVISAIGTRQYYQKRGFELVDLYQIYESKEK